MFLGRSLGSRPCGRLHLFLFLLIIFNLFLNFYRLTWWLFRLFLFVFLALLLKQLLFHVVSQFLWVPLCIYFIHIFQLSFIHIQFSFLIKLFLGCWRNLGTCHSQRYIILVLFGFIRDFRIWWWLIFDYALTVMFNTITFLLLTFPHNPPYMAQNIILFISRACIYIIVLIRIWYYLLFWLFCCF